MSHSLRLHTRSTIQYYTSTSVQCLTVSVYTPEVRYSTILQHPSNVSQSPSTHQKYDTVLYFNIRPMSHSLRLHTRSTIQYYTSTSVQCLTVSVYTPEVRYSTILQHPSNVSQSPSTHQKYDTVLYFNFRPMSHSLRLHTRSTIQYYTSTSVQCLTVSVYTPEVRYSTILQHPSNVSQSPSTHQKYDTVLYFNIRPMSHSLRLHTRSTIQYYTSTSVQHLCSK